MVWRESEAHPDMNELLAAKRAVPKSTDPEVLRRGWEEYAARMQRPYPAGMTVSDLSLPTPGAGKAGTVPIRLYRPAGANAVSPCIVYLHGGAFTKGNLDSGDPVAWGIADITGLVVVSADYRLAPEQRLPVRRRGLLRGAPRAFEARRGLRHRRHAPRRLGRQRRRQHGGGGLPDGARSRRASHPRAGAELRLPHRRPERPVLPALCGFSGPDGLDRPRLGSLSRVASSDDGWLCGPAEGAGSAQPAAGPCASRGVRLPRRRQPRLCGSPVAGWKRGGAANRAAHDPRIFAGPFLRPGCARGIHRALHLPEAAPHLRASRETGMAAC